MKVSLEDKIEDFVARGYAAFCRKRPEHITRTGTLQQTVIPLKDAKVLLSIGIYGGHLATYAALLTNKSAIVKSTLKFVKEPEIYGLVGPASEALQVGAKEDNPERIEVRRSVLKGLVDSLGSAVVGLSPDYLAAQKLMVNNSPMKTLTHPEELPKDAQLVRELEDILEKIERFTDEPTPELIAELEEHFLFLEGQKAKFYKLGSGESEVA